VGGGKNSEWEMEKIVTERWKNSDWEVEETVTGRWKKQ